MNWLYNIEPYPPMIFELALSLSGTWSVTNPKSPSLMYLYTAPGPLAKSAEVIPPAADNVTVTVPPTT